MKNLLLLTLLLMFVSCDNAGVTQQKTNGNETGLPAELKGLKVYNVSTGAGNYVNVAVLNNRVNSTNYKSGKTNKSVITVYSNNTTQEFEQEDIISENDSIIVLRK
jgi:hypothetical protein